MASDINKDSRKRKSTSDLIFEVDDADISPSITPEPTEKAVANSVEKKEVSQTLNEAKKIKDDILKLEDSTLEEKINNISGEFTGKQSPINIPYVETETKTLQINDSVQSDKNNISENGTEYTEVNIDIKAKGDSVPEISKSDVDLRCMDMEVANSPPPIIIEKPFISIIFRDKDTALHARPKITHFIQNLIDFDLKIRVNPCLSEMSIDFWEESTENKIQNDMPDNYAPKLATPKPENLDLFVVDTTPSKQRELLPRYAPTSHCKTIGESEQVENPTKCRSNQTCFNCDGDHSMRDCKEVRNARRIAMARNKFKSQQQKQNVRYHVDDEIKYRHLAPGKISDELRRALDVRKYELPPYIYRMRLLGYPPGWLQEAMISNSDLELFDFQGCAVGDGGGDCNRKIDSSKVVEYPGFNAPIEKGFKDEFKYFNCPPYNEKHSKDCMVQYIERVTEQVTVTVQKETLIESQPAPKETESDSNSQGSECTEKLRRSESPSLTDLELRKRQLLAELEDGSLNSPQPTNDKQVNPLSQDLIESPNVVASSFGTPILKTASPYCQLPDRDKFSRDISQVINFENLPDATGKYEQMTAVIDKVRKTVKNNKS